jgi:hypothetical protein
MGLSVLATAANMANDQVDSGQNKERRHRHQSQVSLSHAQILRPTPQ